MDAFQITLAGRWRTAVAAPAGENDPDLPESLRDHIDLRLGELSLSAHLGDDTVLPFLLGLAEQLTLLPNGGHAQIVMSPSGHQLRLRRQHTRFLVSFATETGRSVVRNVPADATALQRAVHRVGSTFVTDLLVARPTWRRLLVVRRFQDALAGLFKESSVPSHGASARVASGPRRARRTASMDFPLTVTESGLRLGAQPASSDVGSGRRGTLQRLLGAVEALAREPECRASIPWSASPRTQLQFERLAPGLVTWVLRDAVAPWMTGRTPLSGLLRHLRAAALAMPEFDPTEARLRLAAIRRWLRAESIPPLLGEPLVLVPPEAVGVAGTAPPLEARRLVHVAYRRLWRRALKRFFLPAQTLTGDTILVHTTDGATGLARETGRERWRLPGAHPLLASGPPELLLDARGRLMCIDPTTGETRWCESRRWHQTPAVAVQQDALGFVVITEAGELVAFDADGHRVVTARLAAGTSHALTLGPTLIWAAGEDRHLSAFRRGDGSLHFRVPLDGHAVGAPHWTSGALIAAVERGSRAHVMSFDPATGCMRSEHPLPGQVLSVQRVGAANRDLVAVQTLTDEGTLTSVFDAESGRLQFTLPIGPGRATLTAYQGALYLGGEGGQVSAYDARDGGALWTRAGDEAGEETTLHVRPLGVRGLLYVLGSTLRILEPATGRVVSRYALDGFEVGAWLVSPTGDVLMADPERALVYLRLSGHLSRVD